MIEPEAGTPAPTMWPMPLPAADATDLLLAVDPADYAASAIARAVEDCDAQLLNLNILPQGDSRGRALVAIRAGRLNGAAIARSLERYGFEVADIRGPRPADDDSLASRADQLLRYLSM
jgi:hypothetical protein